MKILFGARCSIFFILGQLVVLLTNNSRVAVLAQNNTSNNQTSTSDLTVVAPNNTNTNVTTIISNGTSTASPTFDTPVNVTTTNLTDTQPIDLATANTTVDSNATDKITDQNATTTDSIITDTSVTNTTDTSDTNTTDTSDAADTSDVKTSSNLTDTSTFNNDTTTDDDTIVTTTDSGADLHNYSQGTLMNAIDDLAEEEFNEDGLRFFREALIAVDLLDEILGVESDDNSTTYTVFAPTNAAIQANRIFMQYMKGIDELPQPRWYENLKAVVLHHIIPNEELMYDNLFDSQRSYLDSMLTPETNSTIQISQFSKTVGGAKLVADKLNIQTTNGILHVVTQVISPEFMSQPFGMLELQEEYGPDPLERVSLSDVVAVTGARDILNTMYDSGLTFAGCRIRAFNRIDEYLNQTINGSSNITYGEFLNTSFVNETRVNLFEYSLIPKNYYYDDIEDGFVELITPVSGEKCNGANMWITKQEGVLCFNNGCTIETPDLRKYYASNGIGYVVDKCQVCHGTAMLVNVAAEYTGGLYNLRDTAQFFIASGWNLRDLRLSIGDGTDMTLFAPMNTGWDSFNLEDVTRLAGEEWDPHKLDLLKHFIVQGRYTYGDLYAKYEADGPFNLTMLTGEPVIVDYRSEEKVITISGGDLFYKDIQGVDGLVHFVTEVPLPKSMTDSVYDYGQKLEEFKTQITLIDSVSLAADLNRLLPLTLLLAPNPTWDNKVIDYEQISKSVLENMIFGKLLWCDTLREMSGITSAESHNQKYWSITINDDDMPCFEYDDGTVSRGSGVTLLRSCVTKCDILVRNGIVHEVDNVLLFETPETLPPQAEGARLPGMTGDNYDEPINSNTQQDYSNGGTTSGGDGSASNAGSSGFQRPTPTLDDVAGKTSSTFIPNSTTQQVLIMTVAAMVLSVGKI